MSEFISKSKAKKLGNNKFQSEIVDLNSKINVLNESIENKNNELQLFKDNFVSLQNEIQSKNAKISELSDESLKIFNENDNVHKQLHAINNMNSTLLTTLETEKQILLNHKIEDESIINQISNDKNDLLKNFNDIKLKYQDTLSKLQSKTTEYHDLENLNNTLLSELNLVKELNTTKEVEINSVRNELIKLGDVILTLQQDIFDKNEYITNLNKQSIPQFLTFNARPIENPTEEINVQKAQNIPLSRRTRGRR
jgi:chromosome segregation ATPase